MKKRVKLKYSFQFALIREFEFNNRNNFGGILTMKKRMALIFVVLVLICSILGTCLVGCVENKPSNPTCVSHVDADKDGKCDVCGKDVPLGGQEHDCDVDGHVDANGDKVCDVCGKVIIDGSDIGIADAFDYVDPTTCSHEDGDGNCVCDHCKTGLAHVDADSDGVCDTCHNKLRDLSKNQTYNDAVTTVATLWNTHRYQTNDDSYPIDLINCNLYDFFFNGDKSGYEIWPVMAAAYPEDVTQSVKEMDFWKDVIPADAVDSYAYKIRLNENAKFSNGHVINADTYVQSFERLMNPDLMNYRANDQMSGNVVIYGAKNYYYSKTESTMETPESLGYESIAAALADGKEVLVDVWDFWGAEGYVDAEGNACPQYLSVTDETIYDSVEGWAGTAKPDDFSAALLLEVYGAYLEVGAPYHEDVVIEVINDQMGYTFDKVGIFKTGEYDYTIVLEKPCKGFYLLYGLASSWIVDIETYDASLSQDEVTGEWKNAYNTSLETSVGYGPYKMTQYDATTMVFERDLNWWGYNDPRFDTMYHTSKVYTRQIEEAETRKSMFLQGDLMGYGLDAADYEAFGNSKYLYSTPGTTVFFMVLSCNENALKTAQSAKENVNKTILVRDDFREALSVAFNKADFCNTISPSRTPAYSVVGAYDIWNPTTGEKYRATETAKKGLVAYYGFEAHKETIQGVEIEYYSVPGSSVKYSLDEAVDAVTGYNPELAKAKFLAAYEAELADGKIGPNDVIEIEYSMSAASAFMTKTIEYLNNSINNILKGTVLENRVKIVESAPKGTKWSDDLKSGVSQTCLCGWQGGALDPFNSMLYYVEPGHDPYASQYWDTTKVTATITLPVGENGADVTLTMSLCDWGLCLTGESKTVNGETYNFGYQQCDDSIRLSILSALENAILGSLYYIPMMQDGSNALLSQKVSYVLGRDEYNAVLGRGGMTYMTYNYTDEEWETVKGSLSY